MPNETTWPIRQERLKRGMTLAELAERCEAEGAPVTEGQMSRIERGIFTPRPRLRAVLRRLLDLDENLERKVEVTS